jgi:hypothetical protein
MDQGERFSLEVRTVLVGWRGVMRQIRAGLLPDSRESVQRVTARSLRLLADVGARYPELDRNRHALQLLRDAREEIHGASHHDLDDAGELEA